LVQVAVGWHVLAPFVEHSSISTQLEAEEEAQVAESLLVAGAKPAAHLHWLLLHT